VILLDISEIIRRRRAELGITLLEIAKKVGVTEATVQRWESGYVKNLRHGRIVKLADALKMHPADLLGWTTPNITDEEAKLLEAYQRAKESDKAVVKSLVEAIDKLLVISEQKDDAQR
jgi:transcriptional regulator with XRE-family HTH domain